MKGPTRRVVDHKGYPYKGYPKTIRKSRDEVAKAAKAAREAKELKKRLQPVKYLHLWRFSDMWDKLMSATSMLLALCSSGGLVIAVLIYGELTALFVQRSAERGGVTRAPILGTLGGGTNIDNATSRADHMDALLDDSSSFTWWSAITIVIQWMCAALSVYLSEFTSNRMARQLRRLLLQAMMKQEMGFFDTENTLDLNTALTEQVENLRNGVGAHLPQCVYLGGAATAGAGVAIAAGWHLALTALAVVPIAVLVATTVSNYATRCSNEEVKAYGVAGKCAEETIAGVKTVRAWGGADGEVNRYQEALKGASNAGARRGTAAAVGAGVAWLLTYSLNSVVFAYGANLIVADMHLSPEEKLYHPGTMITVLFLTFMCAQNIAMLQPHLEVMSNARSAAAPLFYLLDRKPVVDALDRGGLRPRFFRGDIKFSDIYFNYPSRPNVKVLRGLDLQITAGQTVALVGSSGCGKSTLLQLLQRLYEPSSGSIIIDGLPIEQLHLNFFRNSIGVVGQEPVLFGGTIMDNITLGDTRITDEKVHAAAKTAHAHQFIEKLKSGYSTYLGSGGAQLSGGQKQRIAIARALVRDPKILLLDEPTSALDPVSEKQKNKYAKNIRVARLKRDKPSRKATRKNRRSMMHAILEEFSSSYEFTESTESSNSAKEKMHVQAALDAASVGRTTIVVSHRLSTIINADTIVYMEQGVVVEKGTYTELMMKEGAFFHLANTDMQQQQQRSEPVLNDDDDDVVEGTTLKRSPSNGSVWSTRRSFRVVSAGSLRIPAASTPDHVILHEEVVEDENSSSDKDDLTASRVSTWDLLKLNAPEWRLLVGGGIASFLIGATMPIFALLFSKLYGMFSLEDGAVILSQAYMFAGGFAAVATLCGVVTFLQTWLFNKAGSRLTDRLRIETFKAYLKQEQAWFDQPQNSVGALCSRLANDCAAVQGATGTRLGTVLQGISTMVIGVTLAACFSWKMTLVSLLSVPFVIGGIYVESVVSRICESKSRKALNDASRIAAESIINIRTLHSLGAEYWALNRYNAALQSGFSRSSTTAVARGVVYGLSLCAPTLGYAVALAYGGYLIAREDMPYENAILVSEALIYGAWMLAEALSFAPNFASARRSGGRLLAILNRTPAIADAPQQLAVKEESSEASVVFENVSFTYPSRAGAPVLRKVSVSVPSGKTLALVGPSGCGKSTLLQLLLRMYDADQGSILVSSRNVARDWWTHELRRQFALVQQEPALFARSIRENIAYGDLGRTVTDQDVINAAKAAHVHQFITSLPLGYETPLGSGGAQLSGGQKQRIAIARALLRNPKVLLLDEPTSALDASSEKEVHKSLMAASEGRTTIMIAHRLATVRHADIICVLDQGKVVETGSHKELLSLNGAYCRLLQEQGGISQTHGGDIRHDHGGDMQPTHGTDIAQVHAGNT